MATREGIREGIAEEIYLIHLELKYGCKQVVTLPIFPRLNKNIQKQLLGWADQIMKREDSQGVVIKVDRELPWLWKTDRYNQMWGIPLEDVEGLVAVEPLIME